MTVALDESKPDVDVVVIGAGVNGTGVARDCAQRGLKVALFERNDVAFGASGNSSGMIHGGPRYLPTSPDVTYTSCLDSGHIQRIASHLLFRIPFLIPIYGRSGLLSKLALTGYDGFFEAYDRYQRLKHGKRHVLLNRREMVALEPGLIETAGGVSFDEWGIDGVRLCIGNAIDAVEHGAELHVHTSVTEILRRDDGKVTGVRYRDRLSGESGVRTCHVVVNASGAWAPITASLANLPAETARVRPGKGIHVFLDRRLTNYAIVARAIDGRQVFLLPWQNMSVIGTTDDDYYGDLDDVLATGDEVRYLTQAIAGVFPAIRGARAIGTSAGVRPTLHAWGVHEEELSRAHEIVDHAQHAADGLYSMIGGKLASYRLFAEEMSDVIAQRLSVAVPCRTHLLPLPGGEEHVDPSELAARGALEAVTARRLEYRHGGRALRIVERILTNPREAAVVCPCEPVTEAEIRYVIAHEFARTVDDVSRRTRLGLGACGGMHCAARCAHIVAQMTGQSPERARYSALQFLNKGAERRVVALGPVQARQEALALAAVRAELGDGLEV
jgi:glycerol-3-phosphate dehydrogenase